MREEWPAHFSQTGGVIICCWHRPVINDFLLHPSVDTHKASEAEWNQGQDSASLRTDFLCEPNSAHLTCVSIITEVNGTSHKSKTYRIWPSTYTGVCMAAC